MEISIDKEQIQTSEARLTTKYYAYKCLEACAKLIESAIITNPLVGEGSISAPIESLQIHSTLALVHELIGLLYEDYSPAVCSVVAQSLYNVSKKLASGYGFRIMEDCIKSLLERVGKNKCFEFRRTSGLSQAVVKILSAQDPDIRALLLREIINWLTEPIIGLNDPMSEVPQKIPYNDIVPRINILKAIMQSSYLARDTQKYIGLAFSCCLRALDFPIYSLKNSGSSLASALITRLFGTKITTPKNGTTREMTFHELYTGYGDICAQIIRYMDSPKVKHYSEPSSEGNLSIHFIFTILKHLKPQHSDFMLSSNPKKAHLASIIRNYIGSRSFIIRSLSAEALIPLMTVNYNLIEHLGSMISNMPFTGRTKSHGELYLLKRIFSILIFSDESEDMIISTALVMLTSDRVIDLLMSIFHQVTCPVTLSLATDLVGSVYFNIKLTEDFKTRVLTSQQLRKFNESRDILITAVTDAFKRAALSSDIFSTTELRRSLSKFLAKIVIQCPQHSDNILDIILYAGNCSKMLTEITKTFGDQIMNSVLDPGAITLIFLKIRGMLCDSAINPYLKAEVYYIIGAILSKYGEIAELDTSHITFHGTLDLLNEIHDCRDEDMIVKLLGALGVYMSRFPPSNGNISLWYKFVCLSKGLLSSERKSGLKIALLNAIGQAISAFNMHAFRNNIFVITNLFVLIYRSLCSEDSDIRAEAVVLVSEILCCHDIELSQLHAGSGVHLNEYMSRIFLWKIFTSARFDAKSAACASRIILKELLMDVDTGDFFPERDCVESVYDKGSINSYHEPISDFVYARKIIRDLSLSTIKDASFDAITYKRLENCVSRINFSNISESGGCGLVISEIIRAYVCIDIMTELSSVKSYRGSFVLSKISLSLLLSEKIKALRTPGRLSLFHFLDPNTYSCDSFLDEMDIWYAAEQPEECCSLLMDTVTG